MADIDIGIGQGGIGYPEGGNSGGSGPTGGITQSEADRRYKRLNWLPTLAEIHAEKARATGAVTGSTDVENLDEGDYYVQQQFTGAPVTATGTYEGVLNIDLDFDQGNGGLMVYTTNSQQFFKVKYASGTWDQDWTEVTKQSAGGGLDQSAADRRYLQLSGGTLTDNLEVVGKRLQGIKLATNLNYAAVIPVNTSGKPDISGAMQYVEGLKRWSFNPAVHFNDKVTGDSFKFGGSSTEMGFLIQPSTYHSSIIPLDTSGNGLLNNRLYFDIQDQQWKVGDGSSGGKIVSDIPDKPSSDGDYVLRVTSGRATWEQASTSPAPSTITFGQKSSDLTAMSADNFGGIYMLRNDMPTDTTTNGPYLRAGANEVFKKATLGVGGTQSNADVIVGLYQGDSSGGPFTKVGEIKKTITTTGVKEYIDFAKDVPLVEGKYYFLTVSSADTVILAGANPDGLIKWAAADPLTDSLDYASASSSNYSIEIYGTVEKNGHAAPHHAAPLPDKFDPSSVALTGGFSDNWQDQVHVSTHHTGSPITITKVDDTAHNAVILLDEDAAPHVAGFTIDGGLPAQWDSHAVTWQDGSKHVAFISPYKFTKRSLVIGINWK